MGNYADGPTEVAEKPTFLSELESADRRIAEVLLAINEMSVRLCGTSLNQGALTGSNQAPWAKEQPDNGAFSRISDISQSIRRKGDDIFVQINRISAQLP